MIGNHKGSHLTKEDRIKGGSVKHANKGFGSNRELARMAGKKGGSISRRTSKKAQE